MPEGKSCFHRCPSVHRQGGVPLVRSRSSLGRSCLGRRATLWSCPGRSCPGRGTPDKTRRYPCTGINTAIPRRIVQWVQRLRLELAYISLHQKSLTLMSSNQLLLHIFLYSPTVARHRHCQTGNDLHQLPLSPLCSYPIAISFLQH